MPDLEGPDPMTSLEPTPPPKKRFFRVLRALRKRTVLLPILATLLLGIDAWMVVAIQGWQDRAGDLRSTSTELGESIAVTQANLESVEAEAALLIVQTTAAEARIGSLTEEAAAERARMDAFTNVSMALGGCVLDRLGIVRGLWEHGRGFVADREASTLAECETAQATLDSLLTAGE